ncbi:peptide ABC transporter substrate-binding protein [Lentilactobacillus otakiensis]|uniref:Oligopeptide ABC transporter substrate binding protein n=1 Tax=Lentilactobacillus otakiensis DSM 19908 = JCM 15040 TaxID=1423780 RepID=S4NEU6_9LACO|nr:peptide ABC transporter substrate-binding protein [Lentilactobacillus otakiensis]KRL09268.1 ABC transporter periplasmic protein [Lentilactobacillus otakiensis DSM 19908 = JCM 15040]MDV3519103.1 peptide ABC transporter substrate-binding protein [Lentilactobacillus otakiensis]GAD15727.1 oligopeptide ABC transporter substrate binding protein [Lentilactobacillus otakiensis DSM 19908 = JCM 15040]
MSNNHLGLKMGLVVAFALVLSGCSSQKSGSGKLADKQEFTTAVDSELSTVDLSKTTSVQTFEVLNNVDEGLYRLGKDSKIENALATKTTISKDGLQYTFNLRKGTKWSNGDPVTANDFVYSWRRTVNPKTASQYGYLFSGIKNADAIQANKKSPNTLGIKADGKYKLVVTLEKKIPYFKLLMGFPLFFPQNQKVVEKYGADYGTKSTDMVYNGPFKLTSWNGTGMTWTLAKNKNYWDKKAVKLDKLHYQVTKDPSTGYNQFKTDKLQYVGLSGVLAKNLKNNKDLVTRETSSCYYLAFNQKKKLFKNLKIREAISMSIDRSQLTKKILGDGSFNSQSFVSKGLSINPKTGKDFTATTAKPDSLTYNPTKAKTLWKQGLKELGIKQMSFTLLSSDEFAQKQVSEYLQSQLEKNLPGLKVGLRNIPFQTLLSRQKSHNYEVTMGDWYADFADPITFLNILTSGNPSNVPQWSNKQYDQLIKASSTTDAGNPDKRFEDLTKAQNILLENQGITPLYQSASKNLLSSKVKGIIYNTAGATYNYKNVYVVK